MTFPVDAIISATDLSSEDNSILATEALSGVEYFRSRNTQRWVFTVTIATDAKTVSFKAALADFVSFRQGMLPITIVHPLFAEPEGVVSGTILQSTAGAVGDEQVTLKDFAVGTTGLFLKGDIIKFPTVSSKVYMLTTQANSDGVGVATVNIHPPLTTAIPVDTVVQYNDVAFVMTQKSDFKMTMSAPHIGSYSEITLEERL